MMKVLAVTNVYPTAGFPALGAFVDQQITSLRAIGLSVDVLLFDRAAKGYGVYFRGQATVLDSLRRGRYDLVHSMHGGVLADLVTTSVGRQCPTVVTLHESDLLGETGPGLLRRSVTRLVVAATKRAARRAHGVVTVSSRLEQALPPSIDRAKVRVIPGGVDFERFAPQDPAICRRTLGWADDTFHVLFSNNGHPNNRPALASRAVVALRRLGVSAELHELRDVPYDLIPAWINASDALLLTPLHEGSPTIVKECLTCNVPVVSVDVGDVRERIAGIEGGGLIASDKPDALAEALFTIQRARRRIDSRTHLQHLSLTRIAGEVHRFYQELVCQHQMSRLVGRGNAIPLPWPRLFGLK